MVVYFKEKSIGGKKYRYLTKSLRLPDGSVKTIQKLVKGREGLDLVFSTKKYSDYFWSEEKRLNQEYAVGRNLKNNVFTKNQIIKIEDMRLEYSVLIKTFGKEQYRDMFDRFTANFTFESNAIEGNSLTLKDVAIVMNEDRSVDNKSLRDIYETKNSRKVMDLMLKNRFKISEKDIIRMHKILMADIDTRTGYKKFPNFILGKPVELISPEKTKTSMKELINWYNEKIKTTHPLQVCAHFHGKFEKIHPFQDGNGRVGRFLVNVILMRNKYSPLIIRKTQRTSYLKSLEDYDNGYTINLERFLLKRYKETYKKFFKIYYQYL